MRITQSEFDFWESGGETGSQNMDWADIDNRIKNEISPEIYNFLDRIYNETARPVLAEFVEWTYFNRQPHFLNPKACLILRQKCVPNKETNLFAHCN